MSGPLCVQIQHGKDGALGESGSLNVLRYSPKNCEINHGFISLMHVHLVKAQENNYPSLLYTRRESLQRARLIQWRRCGAPSTACRLRRPSSLARKATRTEREDGGRVLRNVERLVGFLGNCGALQIRWAFNLSLKGAAKRIRRLPGATAMGRHIQKQKNFLTNKQTWRSYWETEGRAPGEEAELISGPSAILLSVCTGPLRSLSTFSSKCSAKHNFGEPSFTR